MAGEFEEPYSIGFQTDSLHSGSISFGRFESEDLSWERRSSFSHNRYLEEVEKYSKPGSVIEKKAYFEAHFKKKGMRLPGSLEGQNGREYRSENEGYKGDDDSVNGSSNYAQFDEGVLESGDYTEFDDGYTGGQFDNANDINQYAHFDESPEGSEYRREYERMEYEKEDHAVLSSESQMEAASDNVLVEDVLEDIKPQEAHQTETESDNNERQEIVIKENLNGITANGEESCRPIDLSPKCGTTEIDQTTAVHQKNLSPKLGAAIESKYRKPRLKSQVNANQVQRSNYYDAQKTVAKKQNRRERKSPQRMKSEKQSPQAATPTIRSLLRTPKREDSESCNSRSNLASKSSSEKEPKLKKVVESQPSGSKKVEPRALQSANRFKQTASMAKPDTRISTATFNFKSGERAERRKEFYMKLEEKMHAKEAQMNQIQARTQEKTEAEIKQFRKSLNFKATPMPSFYHSAGSPGSNGNKATSSKTKLAKIQPKSPSPGSRVATRSQLLSKSGNSHAVSAGEPEKTINLTESLGSTDCHAIEPSNAGENSPANNSSHPEAVMKNGGTAKESEKVKDANLQGHRVSENGKVSKDQRVEGKPKMGNRRNSGEMVRKSIKGVGIGSSSGMGSLAVGVAS